MKFDPRKLTTFQKAAMEGALLFRQALLTALEKEHERITDGLSYGFKVKTGHEEEFAKVFADALKAADIVAFTSDEYQKSFADAERFEGKSGEVFKICQKPQMWWFHDFDLEFPVASEIRILEKDETVVAALVIPDPAKIMVTFFAMKVGSGEFRPRLIGLTYSMDEILKEDGAVIASIIEYAQTYNKLTVPNAMVKRGVDDRMAIMSSIFDALPEANVGWRIKGWV